MTAASSSLGARRWLANRSSLCEREVRLKAKAMADNLR
jgi:hypothetical protein